MDIKKIWENWNDANKFSGVFLSADEKGVIFEKCSGFRNRSEELPNKKDTAFGIASGTKLFTGLAVCKLIDKGLISLDDKIWDILPYDIGVINKNVSVFHLLTHTSGIGDYLDEEAPDSYLQEQELCNKYPVYLWESLDYYLKMIVHLPQKFDPGTRFSYSNAGFIMLGLVIEAVSGKSYQQFVEDEIISPLKLQHTGFYRMDSLPKNAALGYTGDSVSGKIITNIFRLPVIGGSDGGLFTCADDMDKLWRLLFAGEILSEDILKDFLKAQVVRSKEKSYGLGVYRYEGKKTAAFYAVGADFGVEFFSVYIPEDKLAITALGNTEGNVFFMLDRILSEV